MSVTGGRSATGGIVLLGAGSVGAASFTITKGHSKIQLLTVTDPNPATSVRLTSGGSSMTLDTFTRTPADAYYGQDTLTLIVGGTLHVNANQAPGAYSGTFPVTLSWE